MPMRDQQEALQAVQEHKTTLLAQLHQALQEEKRLLNGSNTAAALPPRQQHSPALGLSPSRNDQPNPYKGHGPQSATQLGVSAVSWGQGPAGPPMPQARASDGGDGGYSRLAQSLQALAQVQRREQQQQNDVIAQKGRRGSLPSGVPNGELEQQLMRMALDGTLPMPPEYGPGSGPLSGNGWAHLGEHNAAVAAAAAGIQHHQQQQHASQHVNFQMQRTQMALPNPDFPSHTLMQTHPSPHSSSQLQPQLHMNSNSGMHPHSGPLAQLPSYTSSSANRLPSFNSLGQALHPAGGSSGAAGWTPGMHTALPNTSLQHMVNVSQNAYGIGQPAHAAPAPGRSIGQWMASKGLLPMSQQPTVTMAPMSAAAPPSGPSSVQGGLGSGTMLQGQHVLQPPHQQLSMNPPLGFISGPQWPAPANGMPRSGVIDPTSPLLGAMQPISHVSAPLYQISRTDVTFQQQLTALAQTAHARVNLGVRSASGCVPPRQQQPTSTGSLSSSNSKRSGASRRRKAKMYQALNHMVQVVVEQGGDQDLAEAAATAAAATLKGGVPNLQGGSAACASVVQAVFQQRLQQQFLLKKQQQGGTSTGRSFNLSPSQQMAILQQLQAMDPGSVGCSGEMVVTNLDEPESNGSFSGAGRVEWPLGYAGGVPAEGDVSEWANLLNKLLQADNTEGSASSPTHHTNGSNGLKPFLDSQPGSDEIDGEGLDVTLDTDELSLIQLGIGVESLLSGNSHSHTGGASSSMAASMAATISSAAPSSSQTLPMVGGSQAHSPQPPRVGGGVKRDGVASWSNVPLMSAMGSWMPGEAGPGSTGLASRLSLDAISLSGPDRPPKSGPLQSGTPPSRA